MEQAKNQLSLFNNDELGDLAEHPLAESFKEFHKSNPFVYDKLREMALQTKAAGHKRYSIRTLYHVMRWHAALETTDPEFKLNNNHTPFYARLLMAREPELADFFTTRESVADEQK